MEDKLKNKFYKDFGDVRTKIPLTYYEDIDPNTKISEIIDWIDKNSIQTGEEKQIKLMLLKKIKEEISCVHEEYIPEIIDSFIEDIENPGI